MWACRPPEVRSGPRATGTWRSPKSPRLTPASGGAPAARCRAAWPGLPPWRHRPRRGQARARGGHWCSRRYESLSAGQPFAPIWSWATTPPLSFETPLYRIVTRHLETSLAERSLGELPGTKVVPAVRHNVARRRPSRSGDDRYVDALHDVWEVMERLQRPGR
jgi:hypothetical protein